MTALQNQKNCPTKILAQLQVIFNYVYVHMRTCDAVNCIAQNQWKWKRRT